MREQQEINGGGVKTEVVGIVLDHFPAALVEAAIHQYSLAGALQQVAGAGHTLRGTVKRYLHLPSSFPVSLIPLSCQF